jgi:hypothetical protein
LLFNPDILTCYEQFRNERDQRAPAFKCRPHPMSNMAGGEGALIQQNGDPAADMLYAMNFVFIGLHEAHLATRDTYYKKASDRIAAFLVRIQVRSTFHPQFDGAWY